MSLQHENYDISKMRKYFYTKFCSFVYRTTVQKCAALCCIYLTTDIRQIEKLQEPVLQLHRRLTLLGYSDRGPSTTFVMTSMWSYYFIYILDFKQRFNIFDWYTVQRWRRNGSANTAQTSLKKTSGPQTAQTLTHWTATCGEPCWRGSMSWNQNRRSAECRGAQNGAADYQRRSAQWNSSKICSAFSQTSCCVYQTWRRTFRAFA